MISQPLTLTGIASANSAQAVIAVPNGGMVLEIDSVFGFTLADLQRRTESSVANNSPGCVPCNCTF